MMREFLRTKIHRGVVTRADLNYVGSISIAPDLLKAAGILPNEAVEVYNITNGSRFKTYAIAGQPGEIGINGAAAHLANVGDLVIICAYAHFSSDEIPPAAPTVVILDGKKNQLP